MAERCESARYLINFQPEDENLQPSPFLPHYCLLRVGPVKVKECHPRCVYQNCNGLIINNGSQKHNYICKYNNLPTTCFGLILPSSGWNTVSEENYLSDLSAGL